MSKNEEQNRWWSKYGPPPFRSGDRVRPAATKAKYYANLQHGWYHNQYRSVYSVRQVPHPHGDYWVLSIFNPVTHRYSEYNPHNFIKQEDDEMLRYEKEKYIGMRVREGTTDPFDVFENKHTGFKDSRSECQRIVADMAVEGEQWLVLKTVSLMEATPPPPPVANIRTIKEYK